MADVELVVKIPEKIYKHILSMQFYISGLIIGKSLLEEILKAIGTGTPLPKGHGKLIDSDEIGLSDFEIVMCDGNYKEALLILISKIEGAQAIIEADKESGDKKYDI